MPGQKKFGTFAGVFTPSLLTILGVIMYMRLGWVVGNAGLVGVIIIIVIAHVISVTTGLSISSIATDKKVGAGGVYYVLSRSLGLPIGGAIGVTLFVGTALSIALYLIGFSESFIAYFDLTVDTNSLRIGGSIALLTLTILAFISTSLALKTQFFILAAIVLSLISIVAGSSPSIPTSLPLFGSEGSASMETIFAIFFPAVTGFTAGIAMSGDLKDPKKSIPLGTLLAIAVGFLVYIGLALFIFFSIDSELLKTDNNILLSFAFFAPAVIAGVWGATLSSALGGILGGPRILQAMSVDKITPKRFAIGVGKGNEPRQALILTVIIAECGILIGELDTIARICSMFYLAAYGFINLSFFLESWASTDFNPTFKVKRWIGFVGFIATFIVMFRLDMIAMIVAFLVIGGIYLWLAKKELALGSGDIWQSVWSSVVKTGLRRMDERPDTKRNWRPNVLLFSGGTNQRPHLLEFSKELVGNRGIVTNFDLHENQDAKLLFPKHEQNVSDEVLKEYGAFGKQIEVKNVFKGIETIASTFGFSGIEPNTILMGWAKNTKDPIWFAEMTQKLIELDYNVLYLDYDERFGFREYAHIDLWWRASGNNSELMLNISKFLIASVLWRNALVRILLVDETNSNKKVIEKKINKLLEENRVSASVKIISNGIDNRPLYELMKIYSADTDLVLVGIPQINLEEVKDFVSKTNDLVKTIGTTLLVKASTQFSEINFISTDITEHTLVENELNELNDLPQLIIPDSEVLNTEILLIKDELNHITSQFVQNSIATIKEKYSSFYLLVINELKAINDIAKVNTDTHQLYFVMLQKMHNKLMNIRIEELPVISEIFAEDNKQYIDSLEKLVNIIPVNLSIEVNGENSKIRFKKIAQLLKNQLLITNLHDTFIDFGVKCYENLFKTQNEVIAKIYALFELQDFSSNKMESKSEIEFLTNDLSQILNKQKLFFQNITHWFELELLSANRNYCNTLITISQQAGIKKTVLKLREAQTKKVYYKLVQDNLVFPNNWSNNQVLIHTTLETNYKLAQASILASKALDHISKSLTREVHERIENQYDLHSEIIKSILNEVNSGNLVPSVEKLNVEEIALPEVEFLMQKLKLETDTISQNISNEAVLMSISLMDDFEVQQMENSLPISLDLAKIVDFIISTKLIGAVQNCLEGYLEDMSSFYNNQMNRINLLKYAITESSKEKQIEQILIEVDLKIIKERELYEITKIRFYEKLKAINYDIQMELDSRYLVEHAENWSRYMSVSKRKKGITKINELVKTQLFQWYQGMDTAISDKQHESLVSVFETKYDYKSNTERGLNFVHSLYPSKTVIKSLPFYYKQLFQGKQLPIQGNYIGRNRELEKIDKAIAEGRKGAILISGKSSSGKTHFSEYIAAKKFKGKVFKIDSSGKQGTIEELQINLSSVTGNKGNMDECLSRTDKNSVFIFNDIEVWLNRSTSNDALSVLLKLIEKYDHRHTFILNTNLYALEVLNKLSSLNKVVTNTIILTPVTKEELKTIIIQYHKVGGLDLKLNDVDSKLSGKHFNHLLYKIFEESKGNIGLGLQIWLRQITHFNNNIIHMGNYKNIKTFNVSDAKWKWLLYQILINKNLTRSNIDLLVGENASDIGNIISELKKAEMIDEVKKNTFTINNIVKPNIENWLTGNNILN